MAESMIFVYQTICEVNGKSYVGIHKTDNINDGYIGCGIFGKNDAKKHLLFHRAVRKYGYASFKRHILSFYDTYDEAKDEEKYIVNKDWVNLKTNYNTALGGRGSTTTWMCDEDKTKWKSNVSDAVIRWMDNGGLYKIQKFGNTNPMYGKPSVTRRRVLQFDKNGELVKVHETVTSAADVVNRHPSNIVACCIGKVLKSGGFIFKYEKYTGIEKAQYDNRIRNKKENPYSRPIRDGFLKINIGRKHTGIAIINMRKAQKVRRQKEKEVSNGC